MFSAKDKADKAILAMKNARLTAELAEAREELRDTTWQEHADHWQKRAIKAETENAALREYVEIVTNGGTDYPETWDELQRLGIIVEVKPTLEYTYEWGDDCPMWVLAWKAERYTAIDAGEEK